jgi:phage terminase small subunit
VPILENQRHELFAQEIAKGKSAVEAYKTAGYRPSRKNASRLKANEDVNARVVELQGVATRSTEITIESIFRELDEANVVAKERGQASAMVSASALRAKLAGLMVERVEVGGVGDFNVDCETTPEDIAAKMARDMGDKVLEGEELEGFTKLVTDWLERGTEAMHQYLAGCTAKIVRPIVVERNVVDAERKRLGLRQIGNGSQR